jgi:hypothetical protein
MSDFTIQLIAVTTGSLATLSEAHENTTDAELKGILRDASLILLDIITPVEAERKNNIHTIDGGRPN